MTRALAVILLLLAAVPAEAGCRRDSMRSWPGVYAVCARACDPVSGRCIWAARRFFNPVWR